MVDESGKEIPMNFDHGTTTLGFKYQEKKNILITISIARDNYQKK